MVLSAVVRFSHSFTSLCELEPAMWFSLQPCDVWLIIMQSNVLLPALLWLCHSIQLHLFIQLSKQVSHITNTARSHPDPKWKFRNCIFCLHSQQSRIEFHNSNKCFCVCDCTNFYSVWSVEWMHTRACSRPKNNNFYTEFVQDNGLTQQ